MWIHGIVCFLKKWKWVYMQCVEEKNQFLLFIRFVGWRVALSDFLVHIACELYSWSSSIFRFRGYSTTTDSGTIVGPSSDTINDNIFAVIKSYTLLKMIILKVLSLPVAVAVKSDVSFSSSGESTTCSKLWWCRGP